LNNRALENISPTYAVSNVPHIQIFRCSIVSRMKYEQLKEILTDLRLNFLVKYVEEVEEEYENNKGRSVRRNSCSSMDLRPVCVARIRPQIYNTPS
jgi:hypothetical protein